MDYNDLERFRKIAHLSVSELAQKSGVPAREINRLENTKLLPEEEETERKLAAILGFSSKKIFPRKDTDWH